MKSDIEIARSTKLEDIYSIGKKVGIKNNEIIPTLGWIQSKNIPKNF